MTRFMLSVCSLAFIVLPSLASAAASLSIHVEWGFTPPGKAALTGFNLYQEDVLVCQTWEGDAREMDCDVSLTQATTEFTLAAAFDDNTESPHSSPHAFSITDVVQQLYIICLGRAADHDGLYYWVNEILSGTVTPAQLRAYLLTVQLESDGVNGGTPREQFVSLVYMHLFNRAPDPEGLFYWTFGGGALVSDNQLVDVMLNAAPDFYTKVLSNKLKVARVYTGTLGAAERFDSNQAVAAIADVDETERSVTTAVENIEIWSGEPLTQ